MLKNKKIIIKTIFFENEPLEFSKKIVKYNSYCSNKYITKMCVYNLLQCIINQKKKTFK